MSELVSLHVPAKATYQPTHPFSFCFSFCWDNRQKVVTNYTVQLLRAKNDIFKISHTAQKPRDICLRNVSSLIKIAETIFSYQLTN